MHPVTIFIRRFGVKQSGIIRMNVFNIPGKRDLEVASAPVIWTVAYVHYLQLFILKVTAPTLIAGIVVGSAILVVRWRRK